MNITNVSTKQLEWWQMAQISQLATAQYGTSNAYGTNSQSDENTGISLSKGVDKVSKFVSAVNSMSASQKSELTNLLKEAGAEMKSGDFNSDTLINGVSDDLKSELSTNGVDLSGTLQDIYKDYQRGQAKKSIDYGSALTGASGSQRGGKLLQMLEGIVEGNTAVTNSKHPPLPPPPDEADSIGGTDKMSNFMSAVSDMSDNEKTELEKLLEEIQSGLESGNVDTDKLLSGVSDDLKSELSSHGVDLAETLSDIVNDYQANQSSDTKSGGLLQMLQNAVEGNGAVASMPPPPPPGAGGDGFDKLGNFMSAVDDMSDSEKTELEKLLEDTQSSLESGSFDSDTLLNGVSDDLKSELASHGVDLKGTLGDIANEYQATQSTESSFSSQMGAVLQQMLLRIVQGSENSAYSTATAT